MALYEGLPRNFGGLEEKNGYEESATAVIPAAIDCGATERKGQRAGPNAIIDASRQISLYDPELRFEAWKKGMHTLKEIKADNIEDAGKKIKQTVGRAVDDGKFPLLLGGDHSVSIGALQAFAERQKFSVLQLDAHTDLFDEYGGSRFSHACVMRRALELSEGVVQAGIRSVCPAELGANDENIFFMHEMRADFTAAVNKIVGRLGEKVYITIDVDALDPAIMPSTGTPEAGGMDWWQVTALLKEVCRKKRVIGADVVELMPIKGLSAPDVVAASLAYKMLGYVFSRQGARS